jgi:hypothetical protein
MSALSSLTAFQLRIHCMQSPYNKSVTFLFVETDAELNARQVVEPDNEIQAGCCCCCATAKGAETIIDRTSPLVLGLIFFPVVRVLAEQFLTILTSC